MHNVTLKFELAVQVFGPAIDPEQLALQLTDALEAQKRNEGITRDEDPYGIESIQGIWALTKKLKCTLIEKGQQASHVMYLGEMMKVDSEELNDGKLVLVDEDNQYYDLTEEELAKGDVKFFKLVEF